MKKLFWIKPIILAGIIILFAANCKEDEQVKISESDVFTKSNSISGSESRTDSLNNPAPILFNPNLTYGTVSDIDGNNYKTIQIGTQVWMAENLRTTHYPDGTPIPLVTSDDDWYALTHTDRAYCWFNNDINNAIIYGALYTWPAAMNGGPYVPTPRGVQGVCPTGWHLPSDEEWTTLTDYLGGLDAAGAKLMETDTIHWQSPNALATNESGFTALPGGHRSEYGAWWDIRELGFWWSSTAGDSTQRFYRVIVRTESTAEMYGRPSQKDGFSVRCLKGFPVDVVTTTTATYISANEAVLNGYVPASSLPTTVTFEYGTTTNYDHEVTAEQNPLTGNTGTNVSVTITGLTFNTNYHFRVKTVNDLGTIYSSDTTFKTPGDLKVSTRQITNKSATGATLNGFVDADGLSTIVTFEYGTSTDYGQEVTTEQSPFAGFGGRWVSATLTGLTEGGTYHFRVKADNSFKTVYGNDMQFTTCHQPPLVTTLAATNISSSGATLNGTVNANGSYAIVTFLYSVQIGTEPGSAWHKMGATPYKVTGTTLTNISLNLSGLSSGTTIHFRVKAQNSCDFVFGEAMTFTLP